MDDDVKTIDLTAEQLKIAQVTARMVMESMASGAPPCAGEIENCHFPKDQRSRLHDFADAIDDEDADRETHIIILRFGKAMQTALRRTANAVMWSVIIGIALLLTATVGKIFGLNIQPLK